MKKMQENGEKIIAFKNLITGSIDWRGEHELATIYNDNYYLGKPEIWFLIYKKTCKDNQ